MRIKNIKNYILADCLQISFFLSQQISMGSQDSNFNCSVRYQRKSNRIQGFQVHLQTSALDF